MALALVRLVKKSLATFLASAPLRSTLAPALTLATLPCREVRLRPAAGRRASPAPDDAVERERDGEDARERTGEERGTSSGCGAGSTGSESGDVSESGMEAEGGTEAARDDLRGGTREADAG